MIASPDKLPRPSGMDNRYNFHDSRATNPGSASASASAKNKKRWTHVSSKVQAYKRKGRSKSVTVKMFSAFDTHSLSRSDKVGGFGQAHSRRPRTSGGTNAHSTSVGVLADPWSFELDDPIKSTLEAAKIVEKELEISELRRRIRGLIETREDNIKNIHIEKEQSKKLNSELERMRSKKEELDKRLEEITAENAWEIRTALRYTSRLRDECEILACRLEKEQRKATLYHKQLRKNLNEMHELEAKNDVLEDRVRMLERQLGMAQTNIKSLTEDVRRYGPGHHHHHHYRDTRAAKKLTLSKSPPASRTNSYSGSLSVSQTQNAAHTSNLEDSGDLSPRTTQNHPNHNHKTNANIRAEPPGDPSHQMQHTLNKKHEILNNQEKAWAHIGTPLPILDPKKNRKKAATRY